jgi:choline/glycine/proline betaine transport protein
MTEPAKTNGPKLIIHPVVFIASALLICGFVVLSIVRHDTMEATFDAVQTFIVGYFSWFYIGTVGFILLFCIWLIFSPYGGIRLGENDSKPEFSTVTWFAMLFSAGMGIGLLFFSVAEPILHFSNPPGGDGGTIEAAKQAINITFFHWGLHPWAVYTLMGLSLAYFSYRRGLPLTVRSLLYPILGDRIHGPIGNIVDITAVVSTLFGVATSLGLGVMQINAGLGHVFGLPEHINVQMFLIAVITAIATISVVSGVHVGIRRLSELNLGLGVLLCLFLLIVGPTVFLANMFVQSVGNYLHLLPQTTLWTATFQHTEWLGSWTVFYWGWWIAWSPFVGMFIARVSRGRTIRQFVLGVLLCPTIATFAWLSIFGGTALHEEFFGAGGLTAAVSESIPVALFNLLERFPFASVSAFVATFVIICFFVTSSDSGSLVIDIITAGGHPDPPTLQRVFWAVMEGLVAAVLLYTGGLLALQTAAITTALPFCVVLLLVAYSLVKGLREEVALHPAPSFEAPVTPRRYRIPHFAHPESVLLEERAFGGDPEPDKPIYKADEQQSPKE